jgi:dynein heavy chain
VTPKSFLELLSLYSSMLEEKRELMDTQIERLSIGCAKLNATNSMVQGMKEELNALQPELERKTKETESTIITVTKEKADADKIKATVAIEEKQVYP